METIVDVDYAQTMTINFAPKSVIEEILQNVENIFRISRGEVPYQRDLGLDPDLIDLPTDSYIIRYQQDVIKQLRKFEPRVKVKRFTWSESDFMNGYLKVKVTIFIDERLL